jgi:hypothetical protein
VSSAGGWSPVLSVIGDLQIDRWDVSAVFVDAAAVDPFGGGQLDFLDGAPGHAGLDQLGLVQTVDRLGQRIVLRRQLRLIRLGISELFG